MNSKNNNQQFKLIVHPLFILLAIFLFLMGYAYQFLNALLALILHEYAHYFIAKRLGYQLNKMCLLPYGAQLNLSKSIFNSTDEIIIAISGPLFNLLLSVVGIAIWWIFPQSYIYTATFVNANLIIALFNFLPIVPLDGSRVALAISTKFDKRKRCYLWLNILNIIVSLFLFIVFLITALNEVNISLGIMAIFIFAGAFEKDEAYQYSSLLNNSKLQFLNNKPLKVKFYVVNKNISKIKLFRLINPNYYLIIVILDDEMRPVRYIYESEFDKYF